MTYLSARLAFEFLVVTGTPHSPAEDCPEEKCQVYKQTLYCLLLINSDTNSLGLTGNRVVGEGWGKGRHWGSWGCHWPLEPQMICSAPSSWKPWMQLTVTTSPTWYTETSPRLLTELATSGAGQVASPSEQIKMQHFCLQATLDTLIHTFILKCLCNLVSWNMLKLIKGLN